MDLEAEIGVMCSEEGGRKHKPGNTSDKGEEMRSLLRASRRIQASPHLDLSQLTETDSDL